MRKFKHTGTGTIGELREDGYLHFDMKEKKMLSGHGKHFEGLTLHNAIPFCFIEDSNNWQEVLEDVLLPILVTEDGVEIFNGGNFLYVDLTYNIIPSQAYNSVWIQGGKNCFSTMEQAEHFVLMNKPVFSVQHLIDFFVKSRPFGSNLVTMIIDLDDLKKISRSLCNLKDK